MSKKLNSILSANGFNDPDNGQSLYQKLSSSIIRAIIGKQLVEGDKLPPTRLLGQDLSLSRSTVIKAYEILCAEKYIRSVQGSGYFVNDVQHKKIKHSLRTASSKDIKPSVSKRAKSFRRYATLMNHSDSKGIAFRPGLPPLDVFPVRQWQILTNNYWKEVTFSEMSYGSPLGLESLRKNIADYLKIYRNINCEHEQVVIVTGSLHSLSIVGDLLLDEGDKVVIENPTYANAIAIFRSLKAKVIAAQLDSEGLSLESLKKAKVKDPKLVYVTPSNQYPSGVKMSLDRRLELLDWTQKRNCLILEDDYDHEFSNWENPITSIFGLDNSNSVIYQGTFNKLLHPSIRLGYLIVPPYLVADIKAICEQSIRFVSPITQKIMSAFIEKDHLSNHLRKVVQISSERRNFFIECFNKYFGQSITLDLNDGLHLIAKLPPNVDDIEMSKFLEENGIIAFPYSKYFPKGQKENGLLMGYSSVAPRIIEERIARMHKLLAEYNGIEVT